MILDEIQKLPTLFSYLQGEIDRDRVPGRWILTGSQNFLLMSAISQSLAACSVICCVSVPPQPCWSIPSEEHIPKVPKPISP